MLILFILVFVNISLIPPMKPNMALAAIKKKPDSKIHFNRGFAPIPQLKKTKCKSVKIPKCEKN